MKRIVCSLFMFALLVASAQAQFPPVEPNSVLADSTVKFSYTKMSGIATDYEFTDGKIVPSQIQSGILVQIWNQDPGTSVYVVFVYYKKPGMKNSLCEMAWVVKGSGSAYTWGAIPLGFAQDDLDFQIDAISVIGVKTTVMSAAPKPNSSTVYPR